MIGALPSKFSFIINEDQLPNRLKFNLNYPIRVFDLQSLGIYQNCFIQDLAPTFSMLDWDYYDVKRMQVVFLDSRFPGEKTRLFRFLRDYYADRATLQDVGDLIVRLSLEERWTLERIRPRRKRSIAKFVLSKSSSQKEHLSWNVTRVPAQTFAQDAGSEAGDFRSLPRVFQTTSTLVTGHCGFNKLLQILGDMVRELRPDTRQLTITLHQVSIFAELEYEGANSPEGIHQDGSDYIVSALVIERDGILGGDSIVYGPDQKTEYLRHTLLPGQGLFQADRNTPLWHYVTPICEDPATLPTYGKRSIFGFDIDVTDESTLL